MANWTCPNCNGGFPEPTSGVVDDPNDPNTTPSVVKECPWCGQGIGVFNAELNKVFG